MSVLKTTDEIIKRFIEDAGNFTQSFGLGRVVGQLYAYLYFSRVPRNLGDMQGALGISKGSASTAVRVLEQWGAARKVWVKGDRKDYYEACDWFGRIFKNAAADVFGKGMASYASVLREIEGELAVRVEPDDEEVAVIRDRIGRLRDFQQKISGVLENPVVQGLLK